MEINFHPSNFYSENYYCQKHVSDCVFQVRIILPSWTKLLGIFGDILKTRPPFETKFSQVRFYLFIMYLHLYSIKKPKVYSAFKE